MPGLCYTQRRCSMGINLILRFDSCTSFLGLLLTKHHNKVALKTEVDCPRVLEAENPNQGVVSVAGFWGLWGRTRSRPVSKLLVISGVLWFIDSILPVSSQCIPSVGDIWAQISHFYQDSSHNVLGSTLIAPSSSSSAKTWFPNKVTVIGTGL